MSQTVITRLSLYRISNGVFTVDLTTMQYEVLVEMIEFYLSNRGDPATIRGAIRAMTGCGIRQSEIVYTALEEIASSNLAAFGTQEEQQINA